jgi:hypothetical protein
MYLLFWKKSNTMYELLSSHRTKELAMKKAKMTMKAPLMIAESYGTKNVW